MAVIQERKTQDGKTKYRVLIRLRGYPPQSQTFSRKTDAKKWAQDTESAIRDGRHFKNAEAKRHTISELVDKYIKQVLPLKPKMQQQQETQLKWWDKQLGHYVLSDVTAAMISECRDSLLNGITYRGQKRSPATVVRYMAALSHAFNIAINEWEWLEVNPVSKVKKPQESRGRVRFLSDDEKVALLQQCENSSNDALYPIVLIAISTGMRQGEILRLKWQDIDFERGQLVIHESKNNERRVVPIAGLANEILKKRRKACQLDTEGANSDDVFPDCAARGLSAIRKAWDRAVRNANIKDFRFHDLRHTAASYLAMSDATLAEIAEVLGHKTLQMVKRYAHLSEAHTAGVVERMNSKFIGNGEG